MRILEIEQKFQTESTLEEVLKLCEEDFARVDYFSSSVLKSSLSDNPEEVIKAINELTGIYMSLKPVVAIAETEKSNREIREYNRIRIEAENAEKKVTDAAKEKMACEYVANYRRVRNIVTAYLESTEKAISTLQSILKLLATERNFKQDQ